MSKLVIRSLLLTAAVVMGATVLPASVFANEDEPSDDTSTTTQTKTEDNDTESTGGESAREKLQAAKEKLQENREKRLTANKLRVCEKRKTKIASIMTRGVARSKKQLAVFDKITTRVQEFYVKKGNALANYDELVNAVGAAKVQALSDIDDLGAMTFSCDSEDPKGNIDVFKAQLEVVRQDLKDYRTAVKNLIVGVKSVNGEKKEEEQQ